MSTDLNIDKRLSELPPKVAQPFRQLLAAGQLSEDVLQPLLDARDLAGDANRLLGFAIAYLHLRAQRIPVDDVIRMAKQQGRRINLAWSPKRWQAEHDRLSRAEALHRLSEENVTYDVSEIAKHLPKRFPGYLIRTSRRLGMEGFRQKHCVAGYHAMLQNGGRAIAAVFIDRTRWTVELLLTQNPAHPLRIAQIRTGRNGMPSPETVSRIHELLKIDPAPAVSPVRRDGEEARTYLDTLRRLLPVLREHGTETVTVSFDGCGDSGSIDHVDYGWRAPDGIGRTPVTYDAIAREFQDGRWVEVPRPTEGTLGEAIENVTYDYLDETGVDWCNNDGGFGELVIDVADGTVALEINTRYMEHQTAFANVRDIATGEEV